jgi:hypothetical protein
MTLLVSGSRTLTDQAFVNQVFSVFLHEAETKGLLKSVYDITELKHGAAPGFDKCCGYLIKQLGIKSTPFPAKWDLVTGLPDHKLRKKYKSNGKPYNALAGHNRNAEMLESGFDCLLACRNMGESPGTDGMIRLAKPFKKPIFLYKQNGEFNWIQ